MDMGVYPGREIGQGVMLATQNNPVLRLEIIVSVYPLRHMTKRHEEGQRYS